MPVTPVAITDVAGRVMPLPISDDVFCVTVPVLTVATLLLFTVASANCGAVPLGSSLK